MSDSDVSEKSPRRGIKSLIVVAVVAVAFALGYLLPRNSSPTKVVDTPVEAALPASHTHEPSARASVWTCSMHPQIKLPKAGKCPICFMDLIPLTSTDSDIASGGAPRYTMSAIAKRLAEVETAKVKREQAKVVVRMVGMVYEDETKIAALTSRVDGRLDEIYVNFTGERVLKGDPMVKIWSPTLIKSQVELFEALRASEPDEEVIAGAEEKLVQQGLTKEQVQQIREEQKPILYITLRAPISGIVMKRNAVLGQFVKEGTEMYTINDLHQLWVKMDAYESDLPWIRYGQDVLFTTPAVPGKHFKGKVLFIDPTLDGRTRSVKIRVEVSNPDLLLKPGMFVSAELEAEIDSVGRVIKSEWAGKYICPVHPRDKPSPEPGTCPDSKMPLRPASAFGYTEEAKPELPLVVPATAPLITGKRAVVYVEVPGTDKPTYELREVALGPRAGDNYSVYKGLKEGERVVTRGNFKIDSAMQILARTSMMNSPDEVRPGASPAASAEEKPQDEVVERIEAPRGFLEKLTPVFAEYSQLKSALVEESPDLAKEHAGKMVEAVNAIGAENLSEKGAGVWKELSETMRTNLQAIASADLIDAQRQAFAPLSEAFAKTLMRFRHLMKQPVIVFHCPMALNEEGAYWMEANEDRTNPYFGRKPSKGQDMLQCGELVEKIPGESQGKDYASETHSNVTSDPQKTSGTEGDYEPAESHEKGEKE